MTHILFIKNSESISNNLRELLSIPQNRIVDRQTPHEAASAIERNAFNLAILYDDSGTASLVKHLRALRALNKTLPVIIIGLEYKLETENLVFTEGADLYFSEPIPKQTLARIIQQFVLPPEETKLNVHAMDHHSPNSNDSPPPVSALQVLRDFSQILSYSLDYKAFTHHFILKLREHISFSRIGIFLENDLKKSFASRNTPKTLACIASFGLPSDLIDCYQLSRETGIARAIFEQPSILHRHTSSNTPFGAVNATIRKEFDILGCHLAIPISDREHQIGVAVLNGPVTGRNYSEDELQLLYLLMEELGLSIRNSHLHSELATHGQLIENVLESISSGALVFSEHLEVLYTNNFAKHFLGMATTPQESITWADLPNELAAPIHRAIELGELPQPFLITSPNHTELHRISLIPFTSKEELPLLPRPIMVVIDDYTHIEANKQTALADSKSKLISLIAKRFAHEIRNSLVPLTAHMQLIDQKIDQPKFQTSLKDSLQRETTRIKRFSEQMLYLAEHSNPAGDENVDLTTAILSGFNQARAQTSKPSIRLTLQNSNTIATVQGNPEAITYAFEELFLNALQSSPNDDTPILATLQSNNEQTLAICIRDSGPGFTSHNLEQVTEPFFTTRAIGVGLGLSVAKKIIEEHHGLLRLNIRSPKENWDVKIELPSNLTSSTPTPIE